MNILDKYDINNHVPEPIKIPDFDGLSGIILIVGTSGSGKSTILNSIKQSRTVQIDTNKSILANFSSEEKGEELLIALGLRSIPTWTRPITQVSNGEAHRAELALAIDQDIDCIDEFTSVVDRNTAKSLSVSLNKYWNKTNILFVASCHRDIVPWLCPTHIYDTDKQKFIEARHLRRPSINLQIISSSIKDWVYFRKHHYLDSSLSKSVHCYSAYWDNNIVGFLAVIHGCGRDIKSYWRESRLVVLPEYQGLGIGKTLSNTIGQEYVNRGLRYFCKTAHPALGKSRDKDPLWRPTSTNHKVRTSYLKKNGDPRITKGYGKTKASIIRDATRCCYSHEYIGK